MAGDIIFLDVDGTLVYAARNEYIPPSAGRAVKAARQKGNQVYLCTGRSKAEIFPSIYAIGLDGVIGAAGGFIEVAGQEIFHRTLEPDAASRIIHYLDERRIDYYLECNEGLYASERLIPHLQTIFDFEGNHFISSMKPVASCSFADINKISFLETEGSRYQEVEERFGDDFYMVRCTVSEFGEESGEISVKGINKATAIEFLLTYLEKEKPGSVSGTTYAIGDGWNDREMFAAVDIAIAMGNAKDEVKKLAAYVTADILDDGLWKALQHFDLI